MRNIIEKHFPGGTWRNNEYWCLNPLRKDNTPGSFSISENGLYYDFSSNEKGDIATLLMRAKNMSRQQALSEVGKISALTDKSKKEKPSPQIPIPENAPLLDAHINKKFIREKWGKVSSLYQYRFNNDLWCVVVRFKNLDTGKRNFVPFYFNNNNKWAAGNPVKDRRPLYNVDGIQGNDFPILVVEGEKDASQKITGYNVVTSIGGSRGADKADWTPLQGRKVIIWPDNDDAGFSYAIDIKRHLPDAEILEIPNDKKRGWDLSDAISEGINVPDFITSCPRVQSDSGEAVQGELIPAGTVPLGIGKVETVKMVLNQHLNIRYNIITGKYEISKKGRSEFIDFHDRHIHSIRAVLLQYYIPQLSETDLRMVIESDFTPEYNPIQEYFSNIEPWDGVDNIAALAALVTPVPGQYGPDVDAVDTWKLYLTKWLVACVATMLQRYENHTCLTLLGGQGFGKTTFLRNLGFNEKYVYVGAIDPGNKDSRILYSEKVIIVLDELEGTTKHDISALKSNMTLREVTVRRPYGRYTETLPRRASFCASANEVQVLGDLTGSRRWLCVEVQDVDYLSVTPELVRKVYSQALHLLESGFRYWFDRDEIQYLEKRNDHFKLSSAEEEGLFKVIYHPEKLPGTYIPEIITNTEIISMMSEKISGIKFSSRKLGQIMKKYGFERKCRSDDRLYGYEVVLKRVNS